MAHMATWTLWGPKTLWDNEISFLAFPGQGPHWSSERCVISAWIQELKFLGSRYQIPESQWCQGDLVNLLITPIAFMLTPAHAIANLLTKSPLTLQVGMAFRLQAGCGLLHTSQNPN